MPTASALTRSAAWLIVRLGFVIVPAWIAVVVVSVHALPGISKAGGSQLSGLVPSGAAAIAAQQREANAFGSTLVTRVVVVQHAEGGLTDRQRERTARLAVSVDRRHAFSPIAFVAPLVSRDRTTTVNYLYYRGSVAEDHQLSSAQRYAKALDPPGLRGGVLLARNSEFDLIEQALPKVTVATVALIFVVLLLTFRAPAAPLVGLSAAAVAYLVSVHLLAWLGEQQHRQVPKEVEPILIALVLGLVTDYSIFFMASMRRRLAEGESRLVAAERATAENLPIVVTAGLIVALGSLTLVVGRVSVFRSFGPGMAVTVLVTIVVAVTFIPAVLTLLGPVLFWPRLDRPERAPHERVWRFATARPVSGVLVVVVTAGLLVVASGALHARLGFTLVRGLPDHSESKKAQTLAERAFPAGILAPTEVLLEGPRLGARREALARLQRAIARVPGVARVAGPANQPGQSVPVFVSRAGGAARYLVAFDHEPLGASGIDDLQELQSQLPDLADRAGVGDARLSYAGDTPLAKETVAAIRGDGLRVGAAVLLVNLALLAIFLRALWAPFYLLAASALALAAALGATTWVMQGLLHHDDLTYYVPFAAGVLLLSLGSDYNIFVVGKIWQQARDQPLREAIVEVAPRASSTITTAGLTLAGSFALLALVPVRPMRELALAMAVGILLDTFIVRSILVPSLLALFRRREAAVGEAVRAKRAPG